MFVLNSKKVNGCLLELVQHEKTDVAEFKGKNVILTRPDGSKEGFSLMSTATQAALNYSAEAAVKATVKKSENETKKSAPKKSAAKTAPAIPKL